MFLNFLDAFCFWKTDRSKIWYFSKLDWLISRQPARLASQNLSQTFSNSSFSQSFKDFFIFFLKFSYFRFFQNKLVDITAACSAILTQSLQTFKLFCFYFYISISISSLLLLVTFMFHILVDFKLPRKNWNLLTLNSFFISQFHTF